MGECRLHLTTRWLFLTCSRPWGAVSCSHPASFWAPIPVKCSQAQSLSGPCKGKTLTRPSLLKKKMMQADSPCFPKGMMSVPTKWERKDLDLVLLGQHPLLLLHTPISHLHPTHKSAGITDSRGQQGAWHLQTWLCHPEVQRWTALVQTTLLLTPALLLLHQPALSPGLSPSLEGGGKGRAGT